MGPVKQKELEAIAGMSAERLTAHLEALREGKRVTLLGNQWLTSETARSWHLRLVEEVRSFHLANPLLPGIPRATLKGALPAGLGQKGFDQLLEAILAAGELDQQTEWFKAPGCTPTPSESQDRDIRRIEEVYRNAGAQAQIWQEMLASLNMVPADAETYLAYLLGAGRLVRLNEESLFHGDTYRQALVALQIHFASHEAVTLGQFRDILGGARKPTKALLEHFDGLKYTLRRGDERVAWKLPEVKLSA
jgi:selenocysteine-specific elongation factor